jgi:tetratricopeptide (TPR) repeat protein
MVVAPLEDRAAAAQAVKWAETALETEPERADRLALHGAALYRAGRVAEAAGRLRAAVAKGGGEPPASSGWTGVVEGSVLLSGGRVRVTARLIDAAGPQHLQPDVRARARQALADHLTNLGRFDEAIAEATTAPDLDPFSLTTRTNLAWRYYLARRFDEAARVSRQTLSLEPAFARSRLALGLSLLESGEGDKAVAELERLRSQLHPRFRDLVRRIGLPSADLRPLRDGLRRGTARVDRRPSTR